MVARFTSAGRPGAYLRVVVPGAVAAGDRIAVERDEVAEGAPSVAEVMAWRKGVTTSTQLRTLADLAALLPDLRAWAEETLAAR
jgi:MOSC domain-containing protein YiiM